MRVYVGLGLSIGVDKVLMNERFGRELSAAFEIRARRFCTGL